MHILHSPGKDLFCVCIDSGNPKKVAFQGYVKMCIEIFFFYIFLKRMEAIGEVSFVMGGCAPTNQTDEENNTCREDEMHLALAKNKRSY